MEQYMTYIKKFKIAIIILVAAIAGCVLLIMHTAPEFQKVSSIQEDYKKQTDTLADIERQLADLNDTLSKEKADDDNVLKAFFKPTSFSVDNDSAISEEFNEILELLRENKIKTRTLKFDPDPKDDSFVAHLPNKYYVSRMSAEMIATYTNFENFLRDLYKHEHFLEISQIEIKPYQRNKRILLVNLQIKLYAQKDGSSAPVSQSAPAETDTPQPASNNESVAQPPSLGDNVAAPN